MKAAEVNFDGLVGPTHNYGGLALGNVASEINAYSVSNPKAAALQGLEKMRLLMKLGVPQAIIPPPERPNIKLLRNLGFYGKDIEVLQTAQKVAPDIFRAAYSAASMWTANAATVSPSADSQDGRVHITIANLLSNLHRASESKFNYKFFKKVFFDEKYFAVHKPLMAHLNFADEGAANHNRICTEYGLPGLQLFVYGRRAIQKHQVLPKIYPARQTLEASEAIARLHRLQSKKVFFAKQNPLAIERGVFHNDVISLANQNVFIYHEAAYEDTNTVIQTLKEKASRQLSIIEVLGTELSLSDAVDSYLFNSQLLTLPDGLMTLIAPEECRENPSAHQVLLRILASDNPIQSLHFVDCRQSMRNGGGPACLRLRIVLTEEEQKACSSNVFLTEELHQRLVTWVEQHYRDKLKMEDLLDPNLLLESQAALDALTQILNMGSLY